MPKIAYSVGVSFTHSSKNFELKTKVAWDQKNYFEHFSIKSTRYEWAIDRKCGYVSFSLIPTLYIGKTHRFYFLIGGSYNRLTKYLFVEKQFSNGQLTSNYVSRNASEMLDNVFDAIGGCGYLIYSKNKIEMSVTLQDNFGITYVQNESGTNVKYNTLQINISLKFIR